MENSWLDLCHLFSRQRQIWGKGAATEKIWGGGKMGSYGRVYPLRFSFHQPFLTFPRLLPPHTGTPERLRLYIRPKSAYPQTNTPY
ncbi:MAG: hypothetical protein KF770_03190 [Anaerolineae bacterium]|nr:hypothetical protein [Anaerolineae bacterium]